MEPYGILFVCMGNICRSPLGEGILTSLVAAQGKSSAFMIDSAGTGGWHAGSPPDPRSVAVARMHGIDISVQRARQITGADFSRFHLILAMDRDNLRHLKAAAPHPAREKLHLFSQYTMGSIEDVPDPYYGGEDGFLSVYNMLLTGCRSLLTKEEFVRTS